MEDFGWEGFNLGSKDFKKLGGILDEGFNQGGNFGGTRKKMGGILGGSPGKFFGYRVGTTCPCRA